MFGHNRRPECILFEEARSPRVGEFFLIQPSFERAGGCGSGEVKWKLLDDAILPVALDRHGVDSRGDGGRVE